MLNPKYKHYANRLRELIKESRSISCDSRGEVQDETSLHSWLVKVKNVIEVAFGTNSQHFKHLEKLTKSVYRSFHINAIEGLLKGALSDLEGGFLIGQEFLIAGEIFDSVLAQAKQLHKSGYKDVAAVLGRVVIEDALRRIAGQENIEDTQKASRINDDLKKAERYGKPQWRQIKVWLDIGNAAAHGKFNDYDEEEVKVMIEGIGRFLADEFK